MRRPSSRTLVLALGSVSLVVALWFTPGLWRGLDGWVQGQRDRVWSQLEAAVGRRIVYDRIAPNVLAALDFQNVRLLAEDGTPVVTAASIRLSLDWGLLVQGRISEALRRIQVINASGSFDARRDQALLERWSSLFQSGSSNGATPFAFQVEGFNLALRWTDGTQSLALDRGFAVLTPEASRWGLRFRGALSWSQGPSNRSWASFSVRGDLQGDPSFQNWSVRAETNQVRSSWFDLEPLTVQVVVSPQKVTFAKVADRIPLDLRATWDRQTNQWEFRGAAEAFRPSRQIRIKGSPFLSGLAEGTITGQFEFRPGADFSFAGRGTWPEGAWPAPLDQGAVSASGKVRSEGGLYRLEGLHLETPLYSLAFDGSLDPTSLLPEGTLTVKRWTVPRVGGARGTVHMVRSPGRVDFTAEHLGWNQLESASPSGWVEVQSGAWTFGVSGPWDGTDGGWFSAAGSLAPGDGSGSVDATVTGLPLAILADEARGLVPGLEVPQDLGNLHLDGRARVGWGSKGVEVSGTSFSLRDPARPGRSSSGTVEWKAGHLDITLGNLAWDGVRAQARFGAVFEPDGPVDWSLSGEAWDRTFDLAGRWSDAEGTLTFSGSPGISGSVRRTSPGVWTAQVDVLPLDLVPGWTLGGVVQASLDGSRWAITLPRVDLKGRYPWNQESFTLRGRVTLTASDLGIDGVEVEDSHGRFEGSSQTSWSADFSTPWKGGLLLETPGTGREQVAVDWEVSGPGDWNLAGHGVGLDVTRASVPGLLGRLTVEGTAESVAGEWTWSAQTSLSEARYAESPLGFRAGFSGTARGWSFQGLNLSVNPVRIVDASGDWDNQDRRWSSSLGLGLRLGTGDWESQWQASGSWIPTPTSFVSGFTLRARNNTWSRKTFPDWALAGTWGESGWEVALGDSGVIASGTGDGTFRVHAQAPFPVQGEVLGSWKDSRLSVAVTGFRADLALVRDFVHSPQFTLESGTAQGNFTLNGSLADPELNGSLVLRGVTATSSFLRQPVGPVDLPLDLEGHEVRISPTNIGPPGQTWMVSGTARLDHLVPEEFQFSVQTDAISVIPAAYQGTGLSASGGVSGLFLVRGTPLSVTLGGKLVLQDTTITLKESQTAVRRSDSLGFNVDLALVTGRKVEFLWPNETLPLIRAVTSSGQTMVIRANDVASTWSVTGKLALKTGEINYLNRTFLLKEGQLGFQEDQTAFDPRIEVLAEWKVREASGTTLVNLRASGTLSRFSPRFDAVPYKSPDELQQLVGTTLALPTDYTKNSVDTALSVASDVTTSFILTPFEETVKRNFNLDLFTVKTEILKKSVLKRNGALEASDYLDNTRLFFGKYIGDDLFLQGTLAFRREGGDVAAQVSQKMVVEPELQMEFQTPLFLLNWTLLPQHPENLFVTDNTVTFRWNWSY